MRLCGVYCRRHDENKSDDGSPSFAFLTSYVLYARFYPCPNTSNLVNLLTYINFSPGNAELLLASPEHDPQSTHARRLDGLTRVAKAPSAGFTSHTRLIGQHRAYHTHPRPRAGVGNRRHARARPSNTDPDLTTHSFGDGHMSPQPLDHTIIERNMSIIAKLGRRDLHQQSNNRSRRPTRASLRVPRRTQRLPPTRTPTRGLHARSPMCGEARAIRHRTTPPT